MAGGGGCVWFGWAEGGRMTTLWPCLPVSQTHAGQQTNPEHRPLRVKKRKVFGWRGSCVIRVGKKAEKKKEKKKKKQELTLIKEQPSAVPFKKKKMF